MNKQTTRQLLQGVKEGKVSIEEALRALAAEPFEDLDFAKVDIHRQLRCGFPEVIYGASKSPGQISEIARRLFQNKQPILITRISGDTFESIHEKIPVLIYHPLAQCATWTPEPAEDKRGLVIIAAAGTSDIPVAEEAAVTADIMGNNVRRLYDIGVAGLHRLFQYHDVLLSARVIVAVAGMEGALPSVLSGLVSCPVIGVPTSVGYGASFQGISALLSMLNSCASGVSVVNIDNGFGAGYIAALINRTHP